MRSFPTWLLLLACAGPIGCHALVPFEPAPVPEPPPAEEEVRWSRSFGGTALDYGLALATAADGTLRLTGSFEESLELGQGPLRAAGGADLFLASITPDGQTSWSRRLGGLGDDSGRALATDRQGNLYLAGTFAGAASLEPPCQNLQSAGGSDALLISFTPAGACRWALRLGGDLDDEGRGVAVDAAGVVYFAATFQGQISMDEGAVIHSAAGGRDILLAAFSGDGQRIWSTAHGGSQDDEPRAVTANSQGLHLVASSRGDLDLRGQPLEPQGQSDVVVASFSTSPLICRWAVRFGGRLDDFGRGIVAEPGGQRVHVTGSFQDQISLAGTSLRSAGGSDVFLASFDPEGQPLRLQKFGGGGDDGGWSVALDSSGNLFLAGLFHGSVDFGGVTLQASDWDIFLVSFDSTGAPGWSKQFAGSQGGNPLEVSYSLATDPTGRVHMTGSFWNTIRFGSDQLGSQGSADIFLVSFAPAGKGR